jgi:mRNA-degrading endonuclease YafQ of YafQ-DinJ toxin-antitoxin module
MSRKVALLWAGRDDDGQCDEVRNSTLKQWTESGPLDKKFLEKAVDLLAEDLKVPMKTMKEHLEWKKYVENVEIDPKRYFKWQADQGQLLYSLQNKGFEDITPERFSDSLLKADWKHSNEDSAVVNTYVLYGEISEKPQIYLGRLGRSHIALRLNGDASEPQESDFAIAECHNVTQMNLHCLQGVRYAPLESSNPKQSFLFVTIGESISPR